MFIENIFTRHIKIYINFTTNKFFIVNINTINIDRWIYFLFTKNYDIYQIK